MSGFANPQEDTNVLRMVLASGTAALPSVVFANDVTKGLSWTPDGLRLSGLATPINDDDAANKAYVDGSAPSPSFPLLAPDGTAGAPSYAFANGTDAGFSWDPSAQAVVMQNAEAAGFNLPVNVALSLGYTDFNTPAAPGGAVLVFDGTRINWTAQLGTETFLHAFPLITLSNVTNSVLATDTNTTAGETQLLLWDIDNSALVRVSVGVADSGGTGFKVLRIPN